MRVDMVTAPMFVLTNTSGNYFSPVGNASGSS